MKKKRGRSRRVGRLLAAAVMALALISGAAYAGENLPPEQSYTPDADVLPDNGELFAGYALRTMYGGNGAMLLGEYGGSTLDGLDANIYTVLKDRIAAVAAGEAASTEFLLTWEDLGLQTTWTAEELGVEAFLVFNSETGEWGLAPGVEAAIQAKTAFDLKAIVDSLLADCPYELYWYDKSQAISVNELDYRTTPNELTLNSEGLTFKFPVYGAYAGSEEYTTNIEKTGAASSAADTARAVVAENEGKSDYEKLVAYKEYICGAVSYNYDAASGANDEGGDPWQLIYVFDGDPDTNVVCEGYAKAFQYLCDLSDFSGDVTCCSVTGWMNGGAHMWNIVRIDGQNYLVDVTNCDGVSVTAAEGASYSIQYSSGFPDRLFLVGAEGSVTDGYTVTMEEVSYTDPVSGVTFTLKSGTVRYVYDDDQIALYGERGLTLASGRYDPDAPKASLYGATLTMDGRIGVNFYVDLSQVAEDARGNYSMRFTVKGEDVESAVFDKDSYRVLNGAVYYRFTCYVEAKQMADAITARLYNGDETASGVYTYSVQQYCRNMISTAESEGLPELLKAMLNYGAAAQTYFDYDTEHPANEILEDGDKEISAVSSGELAQYAYTADAALPDGITAVGASLVLDSGTTLRFYLEGETDGYTFWVNGSSVELDANGCIDVENIGVRQLADEYTLTIKDNSGAEVYSISGYSAMSYANEVLAGADGSDEKLQNVARALYLYYEASKGYHNWA